MEYCPYCAQPLSKSFKVCPNCRKSLQFDLLEKVYRPGNSSHINKKVLKRMWYREHLHIFIPTISFILGFGLLQIDESISDLAPFQGQYLFLSHSSIYGTCDNLVKMLFRFTLLHQIFNLFLWLPGTM